MSIYDIIMLAVFIGSILFGFWKGLAWQVASLASIFVSYMVALNFREPLSGYISAAEPWNRFAAMLILFLGTSLGIWLIYGRLKATIKQLRLRGFDSQAGGILGAVKGAFLCMLITLFSVSLLGDSVGTAVISSRSGGYISAAINRLNAMVPSEIHAVVDRHVQKFNESLAAQNPDFLPQSEGKLEQKLQTFKGKFRFPEAVEATTPNNNFNEFNAPVNNLGDQFNAGLDSTVNDARDRVDNLSQGLIDATRDASQEWVDRNIDDAKEAGKKWIDNFNR